MKTKSYIVRTWKLPYIPFQLEFKFFETEFCLEKLSSLPMNTLSPGGGSLSKHTIPVLCDERKNPKMFTLMLHSYLDFIFHWRLILMARWFCLLVRCGGWNACAGSACVDVCMKERYFFAVSRIVKYNI